MAVPTLPGTFKIVVRSDIGTPSYPADTVFHVSAPALSDPAQIAQEVAAVWKGANGFHELQAIDVTYGTISVQEFDGSSAPLEVVVPNFTGTKGAVVGPVVAANVSALLTKKTMVAGRRARGRIYLAGCMQSGLQNDGAQWLDSHVQAVQTAGNEFLTLLTQQAIPLVLVVYSHKFNTKVNVSQMVARKYIGSQRRRSAHAQPER